MRKMALVIAVLTLAGCGEGKGVDAQKPQPAVASVPAATTGPQWDVEVRGETPQAVSDLSGWLIEHSFVSSVIRENGKVRILIGPFNSKTEAQDKQTEVTAALTRAKKRNIEALVVEHPTAQ
ncbi:cell division septation protein DedD [Pseudomonas frederiksbergensis]|uniref:SPOR domain-containing protein n=1 Tax=Pseudomonas frederiksbergensis TaxID=104087 RepID=UPI003D1B23A3